MSIVIQRSGVSVNYWTTENTEADVFAGDMPGSSSRQAVKVRFTMASKGGGTSDVQVSISPSDFDALAASMFEANPHAAIKAFGRAMKDGI